MRRYLLVAAAVGVLAAAGYGYAQVTVGPSPNRLFGQQIITVTSSGATAGAELLANPDFATNADGWTLGAGWAWDATPGVLHTAGDVEALTTTFPTVVGVYVVRVEQWGDVADPAGTITITTTEDGAGVEYPNARPAWLLVNTPEPAGTSTLTITPTTNYNGLILSVTVHYITPGTPAWQIVTAGAAAGVDLRLGGSTAGSNVAMGNGAAEYVSLPDGGIFAVGTNAARYVQDGGVIAIGASVLRSALSTSGDIGIGAGALESMIFGGGDIAIGLGALQSKIATTGSIAIGTAVIDHAPYGDGNTGVGTQAMEHAGSSTLGGDGNWNSAYGYQSGWNLQPGANRCLALGSKTQFASETDSGQLNIINFMYGAGMLGTEGTVSDGRLAMGHKTPHASAVLDLGSPNDDKGFLPPRLTSTQRDNIGTPAEGLLIANTTTHKLNFYNGSAWEVVTSAP